MINEKTEAGILKFFRDVARDEILLTARDDPQRGYSGNIHYDASNGWGVVLFKDCNAWDYIDSVLIGAERVDMEFSWDLIKVSDEEAWRLWRVPGYMTWRCHGCGEQFDAKDITPDVSQEWKHCADCPPEKIKKGAPAPMPKKWELSKAAQDLLKKHG